MHHNRSPANYVVSGTNWSRVSLVQSVDTWLSGRQVRFRMEEKSDGSLPNWDNAIDDESNEQKGMRYKCYDEMYETALRCIIEIWCFIFLFSLDNRYISWTWNDYKNINTPGLAYPVYKDEILCVTHCTRNIFQIRCIKKCLT